MIISIGNVLSGEEVSAARERLRAVHFTDGKRTAGWAARGVKSNLQAGASKGAAAEVKRLMTAKIMANEVFQIAVRPKAITPLLISRYDQGMAYGVHVDDALMQGMRTDVSFTLFLSEPDAYDGGALIIETPEGDHEIKLDAGSLVAYPSTTLHRVEDVRSGSRIVAVGWARSYVRGAEQREMLFDLETARRMLFAREGKTREFDLLSKTSANLMRLWADD